MKETVFFFSVCVIEQKKTSNVYLFWDLFIEIFNVWKEIPCDVSSYRKYYPKINIYILQLMVL